jgi:hypothetical protein
MFFNAKNILMVFMLVVSMNLYAQLDRAGTPVSWNQELTLSIENELVGQANVDELLQEDELELNDRSAPYRFAYAKPVNWNMLNSGNWTNLANGDRIWILGITYEGAQSVSVTLDRMSIPKGSKLFLYSENHAECIGPLTEEDNRFDTFTLPHILGQTIYLEYYEPRLYRGQGDLVVSYVAGSYRNNEQEFENAQDCARWVFDEPVGSEALPAESSVIQVLVDYGQRYATAVLLNNSSNDATPYVILPTQALLAPASSILFRFGFVQPHCITSFTNCSFQFVCGADLMCTDQAHGLSLLRLKRPPGNDWDAYYAGWHVGDNGQNEHYCIQHTKGLVKSFVHYTGDYMPVIQGENTFTGLGGIGHGQTDGGSIGSPLFDEDLDVVGVFVAGNTRCNNIGGIDRFVMLDDVWSTFKAYLDPTQLANERLPGMILPNQSVAFRGSSSIIMYPNPAREHVELAGDESFSVYALQVFNATGRLELTVYGQSFVDVSMLNDGVYAVRAITSSGPFSQSLLITKN